MHLLKANAVLLAVTFLGAGVCGGTAQTLTDRRAVVPSVAIDGAPAPVAPAVLNRDERGRSTLRAVRIATPLTIDGRLNEEVYTLVQGAGDWIQQLPREGVPATEESEIWVLYGSCLSSGGKAFSA